MGIDQRVLGVLERFLEALNGVTEIVLNNEINLAEPSITLRESLSWITHIIKWCYRDHFITK